MTILKQIFTVFCGLGGGLVAGCGYVAFLTVLGIVPRLVQLSRTERFIQSYEWAVVFGVLSGTWWGLGGEGGRLSVIVAAPVGLFCGLFVGMLAAALTEVVNVIPIFFQKNRNGRASCRRIDGDRAREGGRRLISMALLCKSLRKE